jgi:phospholipid/cholesterol/gamma-HCH transport system permease protein
MVVAAVGCERGLDTGAGAAAVGVSTTKAVVASIVWIVALDGAFAVLLSRLNL